MLGDRGSRTHALTSVVVTDRGPNEPVAVVGGGDVAWEDDDVARAELECSVGDVPEARLPSRDEGEGRAIQRVLVGQLLQGKVSQRRAESNNLYMVSDSDSSRRRAAERAGDDKQYWVVHVCHRTSPMPEEAPVMRTTLPARSSGKSQERKE